MRVAILNRDPRTHPGGDLIAIQELIGALARQGIQADNLYAESLERANLKLYDLIHIFHCNFTWSNINFSHAIRSGVPYVVTPVFYPDLGLGADADTIHYWLSHPQCKQILPFSSREASELHLLIRCRDITHKVTIIPNGTSERFYSNSPDREEYIMTAAARGGKGIELIRSAAEELKIPCYTATHIAYEDMPNIYKKALVFVNASDSERMSLTIGEALCAGCRVLATVHNRGNEHYGNQLRTIDPQDDDLVDKIAGAVHRFHWDYSPNERARKLTWDYVAGLHEEVYRHAIT